MNWFLNDKTWNCIKFDHSLCNNDQNEIWWNFIESRPASSNYAKTIFLGVSDWNLIKFHRISFDFIELFENNFSWNLRLQFSEFSFRKIRFLGNQFPGVPRHIQYRRHVHPVDNRVQIFIVIPTWFDIIAVWMHAAYLKQKLVEAQLLHFHVHFSIDSSFLHFLFIFHLLLLDLLIFLFFFSLQAKPRRHSIEITRFFLH